uniref:Uncharacterized protein n=1 Tax=Arundo donax TaxID=35708 RepID=A0A0A9BKX3_ARUDO
MAGTMVRVLICRIFRVSINCAVSLHVSCTLSLQILLYIYAHMIHLNC